ncbi:MAG: phosphoribosylaminoimidazolesuccinocarboxamide synthase [Longimicrobiales bacterium]
MRGGSRRGGGGGAGPGQTVSQSELPLTLIARGKVRDIYDAGVGAGGEPRLLIVASDRISAFDVVLPQPIPWKGAVLTQITAWWLERLPGAAPHHLLSVDTDEIADMLPELRGREAEWAGRAMLVRRARTIPVECVVRGYLSGSAWKEYRERGTLAHEPLPAGLIEAQRLDPPIYSPATKAEHGHDQNITFAAVRDRLGAALADLLRSRSLAIYDAGREIAAHAGIIIADTKFEFGVLPNGEVLLIDEVLTPDSSRFWPEADYTPGRAQPSLDKQPVRDYLDALAARGEWDGQPPGPELPQDVIEATSQRYLELFRRLTGRAPVGG